MRDNRAIWLTPFGGVGAIAIVLPTLPPSICPCLRQFSGRVQEVRTVIDLIILICVFLAGAAAVVLVLLRVAALQEGRYLRAQPPSRLAAAARRLNGLCVQEPVAPARNQDARR